MIAATAPLQAILEPPKPPRPPTVPVDRRRSIERWVVQRPSGRWALRTSRGKPPTGSYATKATAIKAVLKRRATRAALIGAREARKEHREATKAAKAAVRAQVAQRRREAFEVKKATQVAKGRADAVKLNETITKCSSKERANR